MMACIAADTVYNVVSICEMEELCELDSEKKEKELENDKEEKKFLESFFCGKSLFINNAHNNHGLVALSCMYDPKDVSPPPEYFS